jgi:hypothetical protein
VDDLWFLQSYDWTVSDPVCDRDYRLICLFKTAKTTGNFCRPTTGGAPAPTVPIEGLGELKASAWSSKVWQRIYFFRP